MSRHRPGWIHHVLFASLIAALLCLAGRLLAFQSLHHEEMATRSVAQQKMQIPLPSRRGSIIARSHRRYELLAVSRQVTGCFADPLLITDGQLGPVCTALGEILSVDPTILRAKITRRRTGQFVWLAQQVSPAAADSIRQLGVRGVGTQSRWQRQYPNGSLAAHVVGFAGTEGKGLAGIEQTADAYLRGVDGCNRVLADASRNPVWTQADGYTAPVDGRHVYLTIDVVIQRTLEEALANAVTKYQAESAVGVVVDPATGAVLAMASYPTVDLNAFGAATDSERRNRVVADIYEPGSIFKPFIASAAHAAGLIAWGESIFCHNGAYRCRRGRTLHDAHPYGSLTVEAVVYKSSNIGMALIGERFGNAKLHKVVRAFGFGSRTGVTLPGERSGQVNPLASWLPDSTWSIPMGQEIGVTALQVVMAFAALANDGLLLRPRLIQAVASADGNLIEDHSRPVPVAQVIPPEVSRRFVRDVLARVPTDGTGRRHARLDGWTSFGKTGTAQIAPYTSGQFTASYVAAAPVNDPRLVCLVSVRKPNKSIGYYGGLVAGPAVKYVLERSLAYLDVPRDAE